MAQNCATFWAVGDGVSAKRDHVVEREAVKTF
jgi:hypothetical protein